MSSLLTLTVCQALLLAPLPLNAQAPQPAPDEGPTQEQADSAPVFRAAAQLVLVDVMAQDPATGMPLNKLEAGDFRVSDNGKQVPITTFDSGVHYNTRPIAWWFVVICNEQNRGPNGEFASGLFAGKESLFRPALDDLDKSDRVGVAHWCDDGEAKLDQLPTGDRDTAIAVLAQTLQPRTFVAPVPGESRKGELTLQRLIRLIIDHAHHTNPQPLPVILFLHSDHTGMPIDELNLVVDDLLETSGIAFGIMDADARPYPLGMLGNGEQGSVLHYICEATGGQYFSLHPKLYSTALQSILLQLHFRYELGFKPPAVDGKRHKLKVELVGPAKQQYKSVRLRYRPEYIPTPK